MSSVTYESTFQPFTTNRDIVYFTPQNIVIDDVMVEENSFNNNKNSLQLVSLPIEYNDTDGVINLIETQLNIGKVSSVRIIERRNYNQRLQCHIVTKTAFIDMESINNTQAVRDLQKYLSNLDLTASPSITVVTEVPIHWDNGDNMTHLSIRRAAEGSGRPKDVTSSPITVTDVSDRMELSDEDWNSVYIPILPTNMYINNPVDNSYHTFQPRNLKSLLENELRLGKVQRVDFIDRELEDGQTVKSAFIHFEYWYNNNNARFLRDKLNTVKQFKQKGFYDGSNTHRFMVKNDNGDKVPGYFVFKINHKPIPEVEETELNMSQLVAANKVLEEKMAERDEEIRALKEELARYKPTTEPIGN
jgi:hypothetical protein